MRVPYTTSEEESGMTRSRAVSLAALLAALAAIAPIVFVTSPTGAWFASTGG
jgi:hypothetical protein